MLAVDTAAAIMLVQNDPAHCYAYGAAVGLLHELADTLAPC